MCVVLGSFVCLARTIGVWVGGMGGVVRERGGYDQLFFPCEHDLLAQS